MEAVEKLKLKLFHFSKKVKSATLLRMRKMFKKSEIIIYSGFHMQK